MLCCSVVSQGKCSMLIIFIQTSIDIVSPSNHWLCLKSLMVKNVSNSSRKVCLAFQGPLYEAYFADLPIICIQVVVYKYNTIESLHDMIALLENSH